MLDGYIGTREASEITGLTSGYLRRLLAQGKIKGKRIGHDWIIDRKSVIKFSKTDRKIGRPPLDK